MKTYTIHRGTVRSSFALYHHVMPIYARHGLAEKALTEARVDLAHAKQVRLFAGDELVPDQRRIERHVAVAARAQKELRNATERADEARTMHLVPFVPPYVPAKASRVYPALKTCTSPRRAAIARQRALFAASIGTPEQARASGFKWYETDIKNAKITIDGHEITGAYTETSLGYTAR